MSSHRIDGQKDAMEGRPPTPPAAPWPAYEAAIQAEYMEGYSWPFPPPGGPTPWTPEQVREHARRQAEQARDAAPPAPW